MCVSPLVHRMIYYFYLAAAPRPGYHQARQRRKMSRSGGREGRERKRGEEGGEWIILPDKILAHENRTRNVANTIIILILARILFYFSFILRKSKNVCDNTRVLWVKYSLKNLGKRDHNHLETFSSRNQIRRLRSSTYLSNLTRSWPLDHHRFIVNFKKALERVEKEIRGNSSRKL